jgi:hypothetical protein
MNYCAESRRWRNYSMATVTSLESRLTKLESVAGSSGPSVHLAFGDDPLPVIAPGDVTVRVEFVAPPRGQRHDDDD